ncbi:hypothetical protein MRX96_036396 [Rhipicephalus microplus]
MNVMASTSQDGFSISTVTNIEGPVTDHPSSRQQKFQFLSKAYFLPYAGLLGRHDHRIDYTMIVTLFK